MEYERHDAEPELQYSLKKHLEKFNEKKGILGIVSSKEWVGFEFR